VPGPLKAFAAADQAVISDERGVACARSQRLLQRCYLGERRELTCTRGCWPVRPRPPRCAIHSCRKHSWKSSPGHQLSISWHEF